MFYAFHRNLCFNLKYAIEQVIQKNGDIVRNNLGLKNIYFVERVYDKILMS